MASPSILEQQVARQLLERRDRLQGDAQALALALGRDGVTTTLLDGGRPCSRSSICCASTRSSRTACASTSASRSSSPPMSSALMPASRAGVERSTHVMADRQHARRGDDAEQAGLLQVDAALLGLEARRTGRGPARPRRRLRPAAWRRRPGPWRRRRPRARSRWRARRRRARRAGRRRCRPTSRSCGFERAIQSAMRSRQVASEPRHCGFFAITPPLQ